MRARRNACGHLQGRRTWRLQVMRMETTDRGNAHHPHAPRGLSYALVADTREDRIKACTDAVAPFGLGVLVARNAHEALESVERFGPPVLLLIDLLLPPAG